MSSVKCPQCQLTNWATALSCKRCGYMFQTAEAGLDETQLMQVAFGEQPFAAPNQNAHQPFSPPNYEPQTDWSPNQPYNQAYQSQNYRQPNYQRQQPANLKSGLAIASMILGILGCVTAIFLIGIVFAPIGLILGIIAWVKANRNPHVYGGKGFAIAGVVTGALITLFVPIIAAIAIPNLLAARRAANEGSAISTLRTLSGAEATFMATVGQGKCGDLKQLASQNMIDTTLMKGEKSGYRFTVVNLPTVSGGCELHAAPLTASTGTRSFYFSTEDNIMRAANKSGRLADKNDSPLESYTSSYSGKR